MSNIDWGRLYSEGRCKGVGIPWNEEEAAARAKGVPADYVRRGCLTMEDVEKMTAKDLKSQEKTGRIPIAQLKKDDLLALCLDNDIEATPDATKSALIEALNDKGIKSVVLE